MPTEIRVIEQKFFSILKNGDFFNEEITDFSTHLKGGVLEDIKAVFKVQVQWYLTMEADTTLWYFDNSANTARLEITGKDFRKEGFAIGDTIKMSDTDWRFNADVSYITDGEIGFSDVTQTSGTIPSGFTRPSSRTFLTGTTLKEALKYDFGLIENNEPINFLSKLTNTDQSYLFEGINHATNVTVAGKSAGNNKAWVSGGASCKFIGFSLNKDEVNPLNTVQEFEIGHTFAINPFYRDGELDSLKDIDVPPLDIFNGDMSLKYVFQTEFRTVLSNPNTAMINEYDTQLGSVGYLDESYNGFESNYYIEDLVYTDGNNNVVDRLEVGNGIVTNVSFNLKCDDASFTSQHPVIVGHTAIIDSSYYSNSKDDYNTTWSDAYVRNIGLAPPANRDMLRNFEIVQSDSSTLLINFDIQFFTTQLNRLKDKQDYLLYFTVGNPAKTTDEGDKVTGRIDVNYYYRNPDVAGLFDFDKLEQYPHPEPFEEGVSTGFTNALTFNESGMMADGRFWVLNEANLNDLKFDLVVYDFSNDTWDSLRSLEIDLSDQTEVNGIQQIELDSTRGYVLADGDIFNYLKITTDNNDGTKQYYNIQVGYKIPWQSWLEFKDAPTSFFDKTKSLNGLNQKSSNYSLGGDYGIKVLFDAIVDETNYVKTSEEINVYDYDNQPDWTCEIQTYKKDLENEGEVIAIDGNIIQNDYTQVQAVFTPLVPPVFTSDVDMTEVATLWNRYAKGNKFDVSTFKRLPNWSNDQADDNDYFTAINNSPQYTKNDAGLYTSTPTNITSLGNLGAMYGCYSLDKYENYSIEGVISAVGNDDDVVSYDICYQKDEITGLEYSLSLLVTSGGMLFEFNEGQGQLVAFNPNDPNFDTQIFTFAKTGSGTYENGSCRIGLVYNYGKRDVKVLQVYDTGVSRRQWSQVGDCGFDVKRSEDDLIINTSWDLVGEGVYNNQMTYLLTDDILTEKFKGFQNIGFGFFSQDATFKDVNLTKPNDQFYSIVRIEPKNSQSDNVINEISSIIEAPENNLLTQITGDEKLATLEYDFINERFVCKCLVDTSQIQEGQEYDFSTEIRPRNLEA